MKIICRLTRSGCTISSTKSTEFCAALQHLQDGFDLHHGRFQPDALRAVLQKLPRQPGKPGQSENGLL
jgi:hypothetical protein